MDQMSPIPGYNSSNMILAPATLVSHQLPTQTGLKGYVDAASDMTGISSANQQNCFKVACPENQGNARIKS